MAYIQVHFDPEALFRSEFYPFIAYLASTSDTLLCPHTSLHTFSHSTRFPLDQSRWHHFLFHLLSQDRRTCSAGAAPAHDCYRPFAYFFVRIAKYPFHGWKAHRLFHFPEPGKLVIVTPRDSSVLRARASMRLRQFASFPPFHEPLK